METYLKMFLTRVAEDSMTPAMAEEFILGHLRDGTLLDEPPCPDYEEGDDDGTYLVQLPDGQWGIRDVVQGNTAWGVYPCKQAAQEAFEVLEEDNWEGSGGAILQCSVIQTCPRDAEGNRVKYAPVQESKGPGIPMTEFLGLIAAQVAKGGEG